MTMARSSVVRPASTCFPLFGLALELQLTAIRAIVRDGMAAKSTQIHSTCTVQVNHVKPCRPPLAFPQRCGLTAALDIRPAQALGKQQVDAAL